MKWGKVDAFFFLFSILLEEIMATHSGILAWRIPWTEEPGGVPSLAAEPDVTELAGHAHRHGH